MHPYLAVNAPCLLLALAGCSKSETTESKPTSSSPAESNEARIDACALLTSEDFEAVVGAPITGTTPSQKSDGGVAFSQCYFTLPVASDSVVVTVLQRGDGPEARDPKDMWNDMFRHDKEKPGEGGKGTKEGAPPEKIPDFGDEAFLSGSGFGGVVYVLKGNAYISVSVGGAADHATKSQRAKALAARAVNRF